MNSYPLRFLGTGALSDPNGQAVALRSRKQLALLVYLVSEHHTRHSRDTLMALLWPNEARPSAQNNLRFTLSHLRTLGETIVGPGRADCDLLQADRQSVQIAPAWVLHADVNHFYHLLESTRHHTHSSRGQCATCQATLGQAVQLSVQDDGRGFSPALVPHGRHGLSGMRVRMESHGGRLTVHSEPGHGTTITAELPATPAAPAAG